MSHKTEDVECKLVTEINAKSTNDKLTECEQKQYACPESLSSDIVSEHENKIYSPEETSDVSTPSHHRDERNEDSASHTEVVTVFNTKQNGNWDDDITKHPERNLEENDDPGAGKETHLEISPIKDNENAGQTKKKRNS